MDIRTKLALALVSISLLSMLVLGTFAYQSSAELLRKVSERQLDALAESKQRDLEKVIEGWRDRVELIRSRPRLRELIALTQDGSGTDRSHDIRRIVEDAVGAVDHLDRVTLFDAGGNVITSVSARRPLIGGDPGAEGNAVPVARVERNTTLPADTATPALYRGTSVDPNGRVTVRFDADLSWQGSAIGSVEVVLDAADLLSVTQDYAGLGETGESLIVMASEADASTPRGAVVLAPLRHDAQRRRLSLEDAPYLDAALRGDESVFRSNMKDYRNADIWSATRTLPEVGWGLVVKIDSAEESVRADGLRQQMIDLGLSLGAVAILGGSLLGFHLGRPLLELKDIVERIRAGEGDLRADATGRDEVGFLAKALNELLDEQVQVDD